MVSQTSPGLPIVHFSKRDLFPGSNSWISIRNQVRKALEEFGCFEAYCDEVSLESHKKVYTALEELFNLPVETKKRNVHKTHRYFGYTRFSAHSEGMGFDVAESVESFANTMWPEGHPTFCETMHPFVDGLKKMDETLKKMVFESFGLQKYCEANIESTEHLFRAMMYKPQEKEKETNGLVAHKDRTFLTILHQNNIDGLQFETKDGEWFTVSPSPRSFIVIAGDSFLTWSNGRLQSPNHRVVTNADRPRYSVGLFSSVKGTVEAAKELVDENHPLLYPPFQYVRKY